MATSSRRGGALRVVLMATALALATGAAAAQERRYDMPAQPLSRALQAYGQMADVQIIFTDELVRGRNAPALEGEYTAEQALQRLLEGTGLDARRTPGGAVMIVGPDDVDAPTAPGTMRAQDESAAFAPTESGIDSRDGATDLGAVVVTGSRIRGTQSVSPVGIYSSEEIERSGHATVQQFLQTLPQNFSGGQSDQASNVSGAVTFTRMGSGVNLRGLGTEATLVLLNGQRLAPAGTGNFVDVGMIPASAIDRIEVLTDGASAIYGSDAVGGVVNVVLRSDFDGGDTRLRYGTVAEGSSAEYRASQTLGRAWGGGSFVGSYEFYEREALDSRDRAATRNAPAPSDVFPGEKRHSLLLHVEQALGQRNELVADLQYGERDGRARDVDMIGQLNDYDMRQVQYGGRLGLVSQLRGGWQGEVFATHSRNTNDVALRVEGVAPATVPSTAAIVSALDFKADGDVFELPGGRAKAAVGGQLRTERLEYALRGIRQERDAGSVFAEASLPLVGATGRNVAAPLLLATAAVRYDRYDDFGGSANTKLGVRWSPMNTVSVRATYGTSFRAPSLIDISPVADQVAAMQVLDRGDVPVLAMLMVGSNPDLQPETAETWTAGIDLQPEAAPGLRLGLTYYQIHYDDRIVSLARDPRAFLALQHESVFAEVITRDPSADTLAELIAHPRFDNFTPLPPDQLETATAAIIDLRSRNLAGTRTRGLDLDLDYRFGTGPDLFGLSFNGTYVFEHSQRLTGLAPWEDRVGTTLNPVRFKLRTGINWARAGTSAGVTVNHTDSYANPLVTPAEPVASWTTLDLSLRHEFARLRGFSVSANVVNAFDAGPPWVAAVPPLAVNYDPANADVLGRFVSVQLGKEW